MKQFNYIFSIFITLFWFINSVNAMHNLRMNVLDTLVQHCQNSKDQNLKRYLYLENLDINLQNREVQFVGESTPNQKLGDYLFDLLSSDEFEKNYKSLQIPELNDYLSRLPLIFPKKPWTVSELKKLKQLGININPTKLDYIKCVDEDRSTNYVVYFPTLKINSLDILAMEGHTDLLVTFLQAGEDGNKGGNPNIPPLAFALTAEKIETARALVNQPNIHKNPVCDSASGQTLLAHYAQLGLIKRIEDLLALGVNPNDTDIKGTTALMCAAQHGQLESAAVLLRAGADPKLKDNKENTSLTYAGTRHPFMATYLVMRMFGDSIHQTLLPSSHQHLQMP